MSRISAIPSSGAETPVQDAASVDTRRSNPNKKVRLISTVLAIAVIVGIAFIGLRFAKSQSDEDAQTLVATQLAPSPLDPASSLKDDFAKQVTRIDELGQRVDMNTSRIDATEKSLVSITEKLTALSETVQGLSGKVSALSAPKPVALRAAIPKPKAPPAQTVARVLGVDTWNGEPSVAVEAGGVIEFFRPGDLAGTSVLRSADPATQRAEFTRAPSGSESK